MVKKRFLVHFVFTFIFGALVFSISANIASAHEPVYVGQTDKIEIKDPEISKAYYGEFADGPVTFSIHSEKPFLFYVNTLVPDLPDSLKNVYAQITDSKADMNAVLATLADKNFSWQKWHEEYAGDWYWKGQEYRQSVPAGDYSITLIRPGGNGKYVLVVGETESFSDTGLLPELYQLYQIKTKFFEKSGWSIFEGKIGTYLIVALIIILIILAIAIYIIFKKFKKNKTVSPNPATAVSLPQENHPTNTDSLNY